MSSLSRPSRYGDDVIERYRCGGFWTDDTMVSLLRAKAAAEPDSVAVSDSTTKRSWSELLLEAEHIASGLLQRGLERGDPVVVQLPNWVESIGLRYALNMAGLIAIYAPITWRAQEIRQVLEKTEARLLVAPPFFRALDFRAMAGELQREFPELTSVIVRGDAPDDLGGACAWEHLIRSARHVPFRPTTAAEVSLICVSSGSTGVPKLCEAPEAAQLVNGRGIGERFGVGANDVIGILAPTDGGAGLMGFLVAAAARCPMALADDFNADAMLDCIETKRVSVLATVPALLIRLLQADLTGRDLSSLRLVRTGTAALTPATAREAELRLGAKLVPAAGTMEVLTYAQTGPDDPEEVRLGGSVGRPLPGNETRVVSDSGEPLHSGELGVLEVRGAGTGSGYYKDREATLEAWGELGCEGWFRTGDLAVIDEAGRIRLRGRTKDVISRGGRSVFPAELEALLMEHENVREVAVVGVEHAALGERTRAYIVPRGRGELTESELRAFLETKQVATYKVPDEFRFRSDLPRLPGAKVNRRALKTEA